MGVLGPYVILGLIGLAYIFFTYGLIATFVTLFFLYIIFEIIIACIRSWMRKNETFKFAPEPKRK